MPRLTADNEAVAREILARYPVAKSALIPLLHLAQEQDGYVTEDAMEHIAELIGITPAEVLGTCSFYEMLKRHEVGTYAVNICHGIACHLLGAEDLIHQAEERLGVKAGTMTPDGTMTVEGVECIAACTEAPCLQVNYRYVNNVTSAALDELLDDLEAGRRADIPPHGTLAKVRQHIPAEKAAGAVGPDTGVKPEWLARNGPEGGS